MILLILLVVLLGIGFRTTHLSGRQSGNELHPPPFFFDFSPLTQGLTRVAHIGPELTLQPR